MAKARLNELVNCDGTITTCAELLDTGKAYVSKVDHFYSPRSKTGTRVAYFVDIHTGGCFEIGKMAYESRLAKGQGN